MKISEAAKEVHKNAKEKGFWEKDRNFLECLMLIVSETSECCEAYRKNDKQNIGEELADIAIRVFDTAEGFGFNIEDEIKKKIEINKNRDFKHGGKVC